VSKVVGHLQGTKIAFSKKMEKQDSYRTFKNNRWLMKKPYLKKIKKINLNRTESIKIHS
jgi:hypothetical protein